MLVLQEAKQVRSVRSLISGNERHVGYSMALIGRQANLYVLGEHLKRGDRERERQVSSNVQMH